jgi:hypothetical protein
MSYLNLLLPKTDPLTVPGLGLGSGSTGSKSSSKNMSKITIFGLTMLVIYTVTKILNFYGIGVEKYGSYLVFYIFLLICANVMDTDNPKA